MSDEKRVGPTSGPWWLLMLEIASSFTATLVVVVLAVVGMVGGLVFLVYAFVLRVKQRREASPA